VANLVGLLWKLSLQYGQDSDKQELLVNMSVRHLHREQGQLGHGRWTAFGATSISTVTTERGTQQCLKLSRSLRAAFVSIQCTLGRGVVDCKIYWVGCNRVT